MTEETEVKSAKVQGTMFGCMGGSMVGFVLIVVGALLCLTGIGAIVGIPLIVVGFLVPAITSLLGLGALKGVCPWCGGDVVSPTVALGVDCPSCKKRIVIRDKKFVAIE